jgi:hypothetical protein
MQEHWHSCPSGNTRISNNDVVPAVKLRIETTRTIASLFLAGSRKAAEIPDNANSSGSGDDADCALGKILSAQNHRHFLNDELCVRRIKHRVFLWRLPEARFKLDISGHYRSCMTDRSGCSIAN